MRARLGMLGLMATAAASAAAPASATHIPSATYTGTFADGGSVVFDVSPDGSAVTRLVFNLTTTCGMVNTLYQGNLPITDHTFTYAFGATTLRGSFLAAQSAEGAVSQSPCASTWSAATTSPPPTTPPAPGPDTTPPTIALAGSTSQRAGRRLTVRVTSSEAGTATAGGTIRVRRSRRTITSYGLRMATAQVAPATATPLRLAIPDRTQRAVRRALRNGKRVTAVVTVIVRDASNNFSVQAQTIRLRR